jgi:hypothetical protein
VTDGVEEKYGLPKGLLFKMAGQESNFTADAVSPKGAKGWFQFTKPTADFYGVVDPTDLNQSADGAGRYMADNIKKYGDVSHALADYNGGPKAVAALKSGKPWKETQGYLKGILGDEAPVGQRPIAGELSPQFTTGYVEPRAYGPSASKLAGDSARADGAGVLSRVGDLPEAAVEGFKLNNSVYNWWQTKSLEDMGAPTDITDKDAAVLLQGIPIANQDYILQGISNEERQARRLRSLDSLASSKKLGEMGWAGTVGNVASTLVDLPTLAMFVPGINELGIVSTAGRLSNAVRSGMAWGAINGGYEAASYQDRPLGTVNDVYMAAAMGVGMGALTGGLTRPRAALAEENKALRDIGIQETNRGHLQELRQAGLEIDPGYKQFLERLEKQTAGALKDINQGLREWTLRDIGIVPKDTNVPVGRLEGPLMPKPVEVFPKGERGPAIKTEPGTQTQPGVGRKFEPSDLGDRDNLVLKGNTITELAADMRANSRNPELVSVLDRMLESLDIARIKFAVVPMGGRYGDAGKTSFSKAGARGMVNTPFGSTGEGIEGVAMYLRDTSWGIGKHGMGEETFVHELIHAAAVSKQLTLSHPSGLKVAAEVKAAVKGIADLHTYLVKAAKDEFGTAWRSELNGRLGINLTNERELLAYGLTNKGFQDFLKTVKVPGKADKSLWDSFVENLRSLLGLKESDHNALTRLIDLSRPLLDAGGVTKPKTVRKFNAPSKGLPIQDFDAAEKAGLSEVYGWGLGLENRLGSKSVPETVRELAASLFGTTVGYKNHGVVKANAWSTTTQLADSWSVKMRKEAYPAFESWFKESGIPRSGKGKAFEDFGTEAADYIRGVEKDYPIEVKKAGDAIRSILAEVNEHINNPGKSVGGKTLGLTETRIKDPITGIESIVGTLEKNPNYLPRSHDITKWTSFQNQFGREVMEGWWARAYQSGRTGISDEAATKWAGWYTKTVDEMHGNRTQDLLGDMLQGMDRNSLKESLIRNGGYDEAGALKIIDDMFPSKGTDIGALQANMKHRNTINERYSEKITDADGNSVDINLNAFTHSNALDLIEPYLRKTAGSVGLAEHLGVYSRSDIAKRINDATNNYIGKDRLPSTVMKKHRDDIQFAFDRIQGVPQEDTSKFNKAMEMWRSFNVIRLMGGAVWNQATEMSQIVGSMGWKTMAEAIPELKALTRDIKSGKAPTELLDHLENTIGGAGSEFIKRMDFKVSDDWARNWGDTAWNRRLDALDTKLKQFSKGTLDYTGMTPLMIQQKRIHATALVNHFINDATGKNVSNFLTKDRLAWMGLSTDDFAAVQKSLRDYSVPTKGEYSMTQKLDFDSWVKKDPSTHAKFMEAIHRESRRVIQENDLASMVPIMGTTIGQTMFQFMNFSMHGWNKSLMFAMNHRDITTFSTVMHGGLISSIAYMGRTMVGSVGMDEEQKREYMDTRMNAKQIVANSLGRTAQASLLPVLYDATAGNFTGPLFSGMRTTSDISSIASNPTIGAINSTLSLMKIGKNALSDSEQTTQRDIKSWGKLVPLNNVAPISTLLNALANDYPKSSQQD